MLLRGRMSPRRKVLLGLLAAVFVLVGVAGWLGMAATRGMATSEMDWNGDGRVDRSEILQSFYAVTAKRSTEGNRECTTYRWFRSGEVIRVECQTVFKDGE
ncbi:hypothetical protein Psesu_1073 [Pseudoxanthomonas suwonensis 11-1]|uniref:EF-hand domain-containing protein n=1 Tax=Pseudoxanthomonas suwonensis (strain 11-1) TaxID=743721 RepID=E6WRX4_PSEUU|nr:membrane protein [Pseudoxanthomonas suwonensis]ADV26923.1 hypothetical protein Psesu_1073 [Pseudoxanthomonas suwonensis 11-1]